MTNSCNSNPYNLLLLKKWSKHLIECTTNKQQVKDIQAFNVCPPTNDHSPITSQQRTPTKSNLQKTSKAINRHPELEYINRKNKNKFRTKVSLDIRLWRPPSLWSSDRGNSWGCQKTMKDQRMIRSHKGDQRELNGKLAAISPLFSPKNDLSWAWVLYLLSIYIYFICWGCDA